MNKKTKGLRPGEKIQPFEAYIFWDHSERMLEDNQRRKNKAKIKEDKALRAKRAELRRQGKLK